MFRSVVCVAAIKAMLTGILERNSLQGCSKSIVVNNLDWFGGMGFLAFLRDVGKVARIGAMLAKDSVGSTGMLLQLVIALRKCQLHVQKAF
jgi:tyrosyl-tRNA synthetase